MDTNSKDDIIDLTEIVEEGFPSPMQTSDFASETNADPKESVINLEKELDDLLQEVEPLVPVSEEEVALPDVSLQPEALVPPVSNADADAEPELDYLDDIFTSLQPPTAPEADTSLDLLLEGDIQLDFPVSVPDVQPVSSRPQEESELLLPDDLDSMPEPPESIAPPQIELVPDPVAKKEPFDLSPEELDLSLSDSDSTTSANMAPDSIVPDSTAFENAMPVDLTDDLLPDVQIMEAEQTAKLHASESDMVSEKAKDDLEVISARLDVLEGWAAGSEGALDRDQVLAVLSDIPEEMPFIAALRADILEETGRLTDEKLQAMSAGPQLDELRQTLDALSSRFSDLEGRTSEPVQVEVEQILSALPTSPEGLPFAATLRVDILEEAGRQTDEKLQAVSAGPQLGELRQALDALSSRLSDLEGRIAEPTRVEAEQILAALPDNPEEVPYAAALRADILGEIDERMATSFVGVDELHQTVDALQDKMGTLSDSQDRLASTQNSAQFQELGMELDTLREIVQRQESALRDLQEMLKAREQEIALLRENEADLRSQILESKQTQEASMDSLREDLQGFIETQIPGAAARIIREEIQKLLQSMSA